MELKGKIVIFPERKVGKDGEFTIVRGRVSSKNREGKYIDKLLDVSFDKEQFPREKLNALNPNCSYTLDLTEAYLMVEEFVKEGTPVSYLKIFVKSGSLVGEPRPIHKAQDLPF